MELSHKPFLGASLMEAFGAAARLTGRHDVVLDFEYRAVILNLALDALHAVRGFANLLKSVVHA